MGRWHGPQGKGAAREVRKQKRREAEFRDECTLPENTRAFRRNNPRGEENNNT